MMSPQQSSEVLGPGDATDSSAPGSDGRIRVLESRVACSAVIFLRVDPASTHELLSAGGDPVSAHELFERVGAIRINANPIFPKQGSRNSALQKILSCPRIFRYRGDTRLLVTHRLCSVQSLGGSVP